MKYPHLLLSLILCLAPGCDRDASPASHLPTTRMMLGKKTYTLEIAAKEDDRGRGLMFRDSMADDHGMIFVFTKDQPQNFWMKNTRIPLDIVFVESTGKIVSIRRMEPYVKKGTPSDNPAKYAIELNGGQAEAAGIKAGEALQIPEAVKNAKAEP